MFKQLKYFQSVVRLISFSEAAEENYISQSAISQQIQALVRELGFKLFERRYRSFTLTPAGEYFYRKSLVLTADYECMCRGAAKIVKGDEPIRRNYCAFWKKTNYNRCVTDFAELLRAEFAK